MPIEAFSRSNLLATEVDAQDLNIIGYVGGTLTPQITTLAPAQARSRQDAIAVEATTTLDGVELTTGLWYFPQNYTAAAVGDLVKLPSVGSSNDDIVENADGTTLELAKINRYPDATTIDLTGKGDVGKWFILRVNQGATATINGLDYAGGTSSPVDYSFEFTATGTAIQTNVVTSDSVDAGEAIDLTLDYKAGETFTHTIPATGGPWLDSSGNTVSAGRQIFSYDAARTSADRTTAGNAPINEAEVALMTWHGGVVEGSTIAPTMEELWGTPNADTNNTPVAESTVLSQTGRPIKAVKFTATANAQRQTWNVTGQAFTLSMFPINTVPFTIQSIGASTTVTSAWDIAADGTVTNNATDANEFEMFIEVTDRGSERVISIQSANDLTQLKIWGNVIGAPAGLLDTSYVLDTNVSPFIPVNRKEQTYFAHTMPDPANGVHAIDGTDIADADFADWITSNPITGFSVLGNVVSCPDWRGRYLGGSGGLGIGTVSGQLIASVNKSHRHLILTDNEGGANTFGAGMIAFSNSKAGTTGYDGSTFSQSEGSTYARPETVGLPLCVIIGATKQYIPAGEVLDVTAAVASATQSVNDAGDAKIAEINTLGGAEIIHLRDSANNTLSGTNAVVNYETEAFKSATNAERESGGGILIKANSGIWELEGTVATSGDVRGSFSIWDYTTNTWEVTANAATLANEESLGRAMSAPTKATVQPTVDTIYRVRVLLTSSLSTTSVDTWGQGYFKARKL